MPRVSDAVTESVRKYIRPVLVIIILALITGYAVYQSRQKFPDNIVQLTIANKSYQLEIANTPTKQQQGLSNRNSMDKDKGMLFEFQKPAAACFWMKDMNFPIDMIWLDSTKKVIKLQNNVVPATFPKTFCPDQPASYVVELSSGQAQQANLKLGDLLQF